MFLSWAQVLCLPLDVSNSRGSEGGGFRMDIIWEVIYIATAVYLVFINPAISYFYEADEDDSLVKFIYCFVIRIIYWIILMNIFFIYMLITMIDFSVKN
jgi:hypothetical protein